MAARSQMNLGYSTTISNFSPEGSTSSTVVSLRETLEWLYLCQLSRLFFPENIGLNEFHFNEKSMEQLALWAKQVFPELNKE